MNPIAPHPAATLAQPLPQTAIARPRCASCRHACSDGAQLERAIPGLAVLGSAYGASIGNSLLCVRLDRLVGPSDSCSAYLVRHA